MLSFYFILLLSLLTLPNNKISDTSKKSVHIFTEKLAGTPQQVPITADPRHRSLKNVKTTILLFYFKTIGGVLSLIMGSVIGQACRFERARVIRDTGSHKSLFVITVKDSFKRT